VLVILAWKTNETYQLKRSQRLTLHVTAPSLDRIGNRSGKLSCAGDKKVPILEVERRTPMSNLSCGTHPSLHFTIQIADECWLERASAWQLDLLGLCAQAVSRPLRFSRSTHGPAKARALIGRLTWSDVGLAQREPGPPVNFANCQLRLHRAPTFSEARVRGV
jgi:hypothetical protein